MSAEHPVRLYVPGRDQCSLVTVDERILADFRRHNPPGPALFYVAGPDEADLIILFELFSFKKWIMRNRCLQALWYASMQTSFIQ